MLNYITIGANDLQRSGRFYAAILVPLGYGMTEFPTGIEFAPPNPAAAGTVYVTRPFDGAEATAGNGAMAAFQAPTRELVRTLHAAALAAGGTDEGGPGLRPQYSEHFFVGYLRDPVGNKLALFCADPAEATHPA
jgi:catechol 2,3-dioxygenase-like lactoylglutathione lyase family enzyme